jgi:hypothetical protein
VTLKTDAHIALLAPVPLEHLESGQNLKERVAFGSCGSRALKLFQKLDKERAGMDVDVYIYASPAQSGLEVSWAARYVGSVKSVNGAHPDGMKYRPESTVNDTESDVFWEVKDLKQLPPEERILVSQLTGFGSSKKKAYSPTFAPRSPLLINHP